MGTGDRYRRVVRALALGTALVQLGCGDDATKPGADAALAMVDAGADAPFVADARPDVVIIYDAHADSRPPIVVDGPLPPPDLPRAA